MAVADIGGAVPGSNDFITSYTITIPTVAVGDLLLLFVNQREPTTDPAAPTDNDSGGNTWAKVAGGIFQNVSAGLNLTMWWKRATSGTSGKTISHTVSSAVSVSAILKVLSGALSSATPIVAVAQESNASGDESHAGFTPPEANTMIGIVVLQNQLRFPTGTSMSCPTHGTLEWAGEHWNSGGNDTAMDLWLKATTTAVATGTFTWSQTDGATLSVTFYIRSEPAGVGGKPIHAYQRFMGA